MPKNIAGISQLMFQKQIQGFYIMNPKKKFP